ncbi:DUF4292 domain-containing protein [bacterium]|nr:DUF4292 domain-containing protein [bacterium]
MIRIVIIKICILIFFIGSIVFLNDCAGPFSARRPLPETTPQDLIRKIQAHVSRLNTIQGNAKINVNSEIGNFYGTLELKAHLPDSLYAKVEGPFGVDMALIRFYAEDMLFYSPFLHIAYTGNINDGMAGILPFEMNTGDFLLYTLGLLEIPSYQMQEITLLYSQDDQYVMHFRNGERVWVHPKGPVITRWEKIDSLGHVKWTWEGRRFRATGGVQLPQTIHMTIEDPKQKVTVYYTRRHANRNLKSGWSRFRVPEGVRPIAL